MDIQHATPEKETDSGARWRVSWLGLAVAAALFAGVAAWSTRVTEIPYPGVLLLLGIIYSAIAGGLLTGAIATALLTGLMALTTLNPQWGIKINTTLPRGTAFFFIGVATSAAFSHLLERARRAEAKLARDERAIFRMVLENLQDAVVECDWKGIREVNPSVCAITGFSREELVGKRLPFPFCPPENVGAMATALEQAMRGAGKAFEITLRKKSGETFPALVCISHFEGGSKGNLRTVYTIRDITEIKRAHQDLLASQTRLGEAVDAAQLGIWEWDVARDRIIWNQHAKRMFGLPEDIVEGNYQMFMACVHPEDRKMMENNRSQHEAGGEMLEYRYRILWADGRIVHIAGRGHIVRDAEGKMVRLSGVCVEVNGGK